MLTERIAPSEGPVQQQSICKHCCNVFSSETKFKKSCDECAELSRLEKLPHQIENRKRRATENARRRRRSRGDEIFCGVPINCSRCSTEIIKRGASHKYCDDCQSAVRLEQGRLLEAKRVRSGRIKIGTVIACRECQKVITKGWVRQIYCAECTDLSRAGKLPHLRAQKCAYLLRRIAEDPKVAINERMRRGILRSIGGAKSGRSWECLVNFSIDDLCRHLERQFLPGMNWENRKLWHIDHILPLNSFQFSNAEDADFRAAWGADEPSAVMGARQSR